MSESKSRLAAALHTAADLLIERDLDPEGNDRVRALIEEANRLLAFGSERSQESRMQQFASQMIVPMGAPEVEDGEHFVAFTASPYSGTENAVSPKSVDYQRVGRELHAAVLLGSAFEGAPGRAHGGVTAAVFDDVMGAVQRISGVSGYTRSLEVTYRAPMPTHEEVVFVAFLSSQDERTFTVDAEAKHNSKVVATARGVFTLMAPAKFVRS